MAFRACKFAVREHYAKMGDRVIVVAGVPFGTPGATNMVRASPSSRRSMSQGLSNGRRHARA